MSYLIPTEEISLAEQYRMRKTAIEMGRARARTLWQMSDENLAERDADYVTDFITPATPALVAGIAGWLSMPFLVVGTLYSVFANNTPAAIAPVCPPNQVWVFYKTSILTVAGPDPASMLEFRIGTAANLKAVFDLEALYGKMVADGYFSMPITYENPDIATVNVECRIAIGVGCRVRLGTFIIEPMQNTVV